MKRYIIGLCMILAALMVVPVYADGTIEAGVASADTTPEIGTPLAGYGGGKRRLSFPDLDPSNYNVLLAPSEGVIDPLITKVVVIKSGKTKIAIVKSDACGVPQHLVKDVAKKIKKTGIKLKNLCITGTHTHSGPGAMIDSVFWSVAAVDLMDKRVYEPFVQRLADLIIEANSKLQPARIGTSTSLAFNLTRNRRKHPGIFDPMIGVFRVEALDGKPMAILFNFAIHGTCYGASNLKFSGDVMGVAERQIEKAMRERNMPTVAMFINGTEGDVAPKQGKAGGANAVGTQLGNVVTTTALALRAQDNVKIAVANKTIKFRKAHLNVELWEEREDSQVDCWGMHNTLKNMYPSLGEKLKVEVTGLVPMSFRLQTIRIGDSVIACMPGEALTAIGASLKTIGKDLGYKNVFVFGLANGHMGYVCDKENFDEGGYEAMLNLYGRDQGDKIIASFQEMFTQLADKK
ncbi:neutral/alkaline non-lysosomal ceramidase N-terminal domain-containing protein [Candidatus Uabimicrobium sp. HlEnr_7]|uniref:neutral/alkaline non-lysosomal ceramidase N-terminal domain-containing protein n=1 Tax=Candidatus Uabimicrobium helgolandensis TaxID=3095367 RepID=UPI00355657B1